MRKTFWTFVIGAYIVAFLIGLFLWNVQIPMLSITWLTLGVVCFVGLFVYTLLSIDGTEPDEAALRLFWTQILDSIPHGRIVFVPFGFCSLRKVELSIQELELPGNPEEIWHGSKTVKDADGKEREEELPIGRDDKGVAISSPTGKWVQPRRINFNKDDPDPPETDPLKKFADDSEKMPPAKGKMPPAKGLRFRILSQKERDREKEKADPLKERVTTELAITLHFRIDEKRVDKFFFAMGIGSQDLISKAKDQIGDIVLSAASNILQIGTLARAQAHVDLISAFIKHSVSETVKAWGIEIVLTKLEPFVLSHQLNRQIQTIAESVAKLQSTQNEARGLGALADAPLGGLIAGMQKMVEGSKDKDGVPQLTHSEVYRGVVAQKVAEKVGPIYLSGDGNSGLSNVLGTLAMGREVLTAKRPALPSPTSTSPTSPT